MSSTVDNYLDTHTHTYNESIMKKIIFITVSILLTGSTHLVMGATFIACSSYTDPYSCPTSICRWVRTSKCWGHDYCPQRFDKNTCLRSDCWWDVDYKKCKGQDKQCSVAFDEQTCRNTRNDCTWTESGYCETRVSYGANYILITPVN